MYVGMYVCMYVYIYIYIYTSGGQSATKQTYPFRLYMKQHIHLISNSNSSNEYSTLHIIRN